MDRRFLNLEAIARWAPLEGETRSTLFASSWKNSFVRLECAVSFVLHICIPQAGIQALPTKNLLLSTTYNSQNHREGR